MVSVRLPLQLLSRIDAEAAIRSSAAGVPNAVGRSDIIKMLLERGMDELSRDPRRR